MKTFYSALVILLHLSISSYAQVHLADSLIQRLETAEPGYDQIDYCLGIARTYMTTGGHQDLWKAYTDKSWQISEEHGDLSGKAITKGFYAMYYRQRGQIDSAASAVKEGYDYALQSDDANAIIFATYQYAEILEGYKEHRRKAYDILTAHMDRLDDKVTLKNEANFYKTLAEVTSKHTGDVAQTIAYYEKALELIDQRIQHPDKHPKLDRVSAMYADGGVTNKLVTKQSLANDLNRFGRVDEAIALTNENIELSQSVGNNDFTAHHNHMLGNYQKTKGNYAGALKSYQIASDLWKKDLPHTQRDVAIVDYDRAEIYYEMKDYDEALKAYGRSLKFVTELRDTVAIYRLQLGIIKTRIKNNDAQKAYEDAQALQQSAMDYGDETNTVNFKYLRAAAQSAMGNYELANSLYDEVYAGYESLGMSYQFPDILLQKSKSYQKLGQTSDAVSAVERSISLAIEYGQTNHLSKAYQLLSELQEEQGDYAGALASFKKYNQNENDLLTADAQKILKQEQVRQNVNLLEEEKNAAAEQASLLQARNQLYIGLAAALLGFLLIGGYLYSQVRKSKSIIQRRNEELAELNATKDKFFSIIAHDIRSPLVALEGVEEQMEFYLKQGKTEKLEKLSSKVGSTARRLSVLLDNLLNWALLQRGLKSYAPTSVNLKETVDDIMKIFDIQSETKSIALVNRIAQNVKVNADESSLNTIVRNLVSNALKFTPVGGTIEIDAEVLDHTVSISVRDSGVGIPQEKVDQLFNLKPKSQVGTAGEKGAGLGLILCKELVEQNQGDISVKSKAKEGTIFTITLPKVA